MPDDDDDNDDDFRGLVSSSPKFPVAWPHASDVDPQKHIALAGVLLTAACRVLFQLRLLY